MMERMSRGVLDAPHARGMTIEEIAVIGRSLRQDCEAILR
jgi:hypothetical protein